MYLLDQSSLKKFTKLRKSFLAYSMLGSLGLKHVSICIAQSGKLAFMALV